MKSFIFVCDSNSSSTSNISGSKRGGRWFFGENEIINKDDKTLNIPLDNYNYKKFSFDDIITNKIDDLTKIASELTHLFFSEMGNRLIISTPYSFGANCPHLLEGSFNNNKLVGPGMLLLILKNIILYSKKINEGDKYNIFCTWNSVTNKGDFIDFFDNVDICTSEMIQMSPINDSFGYCKGLLVSSINLLASIINEKRNSHIWRDTCHYIFTIRLCNKHECKLDTDINPSSITLVSLGEGIKTKLSGQALPWDVLDLLIRGLHNFGPGKNMYNLASYLNSFFIYPDLITLIYRFPYDIDPSVQRHANEIKYILSLMLFHEKFVEFFKSDDHSLTKNTNSMNISEFVKKDYIHTFQNELQKENYYNDSDDLIDFSGEPDLMFSHEISDAPTPPPNPIKKTNVHASDNVLSTFSANRTNYSTIDELSLNPNDTDYNYNIVSNEKGNLDSKKINDLMNEIYALKQEMKSLESVLIDKNELIVRLEKLLEGRDNIIKHNQETIKTLMEQVSEINIVDSEKKLKTIKHVSNNSTKAKHRITQIESVRPSTADCNIQGEIKRSENLFRAELDDRIVESGTEELKKENTGRQHRPKTTNFSGVAKMAFEKFINN
ncbi:hypothetical protein RS030_111686 [Cryptosporidium xiaoi]|uniref:Rho-GAP domain-containing protein n=1 Tax=Cryptosporidium xiaoi TaxID=659607 RepID=A0AAV9Y1W6_9CRYT